MYKYFLNYCNFTTVHGFKYYGEKHRQKTEKFFWIAAIFVSSLACIYMFYELIDKIQSNPIVDNLSDEANHISEIPFPAVSFCPEMRTIIGDFNYIDIIDKINENEMEISDLSDEKLNLMHAIGLLLNDEFLLQFNLSLSTESIMSSFDTMEFVWNRNQKGSFIQKYSLEFAKTLTPYGFCYTFNSLDASDLFNINKVADVLKFERKNSMYEYNSVIKASPPNESYPLKTPTFRMGFHLRLMKKSFNDEYINHYGRLFDGHIVFIHKNDEFPMKSLKPLYSQINETTFFSIKPQDKVLDGDLSKMSFEERNCYLDDEKVLKFFKHYSKNNCEQECLSEETLKACGCVQFFMIRNSSTIICGLNDKSCYERIESKVIGGSVNVCQCFQTCNTLNYDVVMKRLSFEGSSHPHKLVTETQPAEIIVKFQENEFFSVIRKKQFSSIDFISYCGGILGLIAGISVLSFIELIYYFTIRVVGDWKRSKVVPIANIENQQRIPKQAENKIMKTIKTYTLKYFKETSIHGCKHSVDSSRSLFERLFWIVSLSTSMLVCGLLVGKLYIQLKNHPIIITMDDKSYDIQKIPFPAVTIITEFELAKSFRLLWVLWLYGAEEDPDEVDRNMTRDGSLIKLTSQVAVCKYYFMSRKYSFENYHHTIVPTIHKVAQTEWFKNQTAEWNSYYSPKFAEILTTRGYAFTFNTRKAEDLLNIDQVSNDFIYDQDIVLKSLKRSKSTTNLNYPLTTSSGDNDGLTLTIKKNNNIFRPIICHDNGFIVHTNDELPLKFDVTDICEYEFGTTMDVIITPSVINTDENLRSFSPESRHCYFDDERKLRFYKKYTKNNCEMECLSNHTLKVCDCVSFDMIRDKVTTVCGINEILCADEAESQVKLDPKSKIMEQCNCLPRCSSIQYSVEYIETKTNRNYGTLGDEIQIRFRFKDSEFIPLRRFQQFTVLDFLASCGGLLGLFAGVSALSIVELFYFFTIRCISNIINFIRK